VNAKGEVAWRSRKEVMNRAASYAVGLRERGLRRGDVCLIVLPTTEYCAELLVGTLLLGALPLLIAPATIRGQNSNLVEILRATIKRTKARLAICPDTMAPLEEEIAGARRSTTVLFGEDCIEPGSPEGLPRVAPASEDLAAMQLTSGTTGLPRVCVWRHRGVLASLDAMVPAMALSDDDICLNWTPLYHDMGLVNNFFLCMTRGVPLVLMSPQDFVKRPALWLRALSDTGATVTWSPNFGYAVAAQRIRDEELEGVRLDGVKAFWNAAERIHFGTIQDFYQRFEPYGVSLQALKTNFGCAENVGGATFSDPEGTFVFEKVDREALQNKRIARTVTGDGDDTVSLVGCGRPAPGIKIHILSRTGRRLPDGHVGEVALETPSRMQGYLANQKETRKAVKGDLVLTGDLGYMRGDEFYWAGRVRERITIRGKKLDPSDLERTLLLISTLRKGCFAAFGVDDEKTGTQRIVIVTEVVAGTERQPDEIVREVREKVSLELGLPVSEVVLVEPGTLTKTSSGKRRHRHFRQMYLNGELKSWEGPASAVVPAKGVAR
jgi:acyl-CoA synthetase (AMP-forming)/AMP-acid ligase II